MEKRVFRILPATGNSALVSAGTSLYNTTTGALNITNGQLGVFNYETKVAVDPASLGGVKSVFVARGLANGIIQSLRIDLKDVQTASKECYAAGVAEVWKLGWTRTDCNQEYQVKVIADSVEIMESLGHNFLEKTFTYKTDCCKECEGGCADGDCADLANNLVSVINADPDQLFSAQLDLTNDFAAQTITVAAATYTTGAVSIDLRSAATVSTANVIRLAGPFPTGSAALLQSVIQAQLDAAGFGGEVTVTEVSSNYSIVIKNTSAERFGIGAHATTAATADSAATSALASPANVDSCPSVQITANFKGLTSYCSLNPDYVFPNGVRLRVIPMEHFGCVATATKTVQGTYTKGAGYDWADRAEQASGLYQDSVYRFAPSIRPDDPRTNLVDINTNYISYTVSHHDKHEGAPSGHYFESELVTVVLIPSTSGTTETSMDTMWNALFNAGVSGC
jgi:hypothetical protein